MLLASTGKTAKIACHPGILLVRPVNTNEETTNAKFAPVASAKRFGTRFAPVASRTPVSAFAFA